MIITLISDEEKNFYKEVKKYFDAWGIPADDTGRTDKHEMLCASSNPGYKGNIPDDKMLTTAKEGYVLTLRKDSACESKFSFDVFLEDDKRFTLTGRFIKKNQIQVLDIRPY